MIWLAYNKFNRSFGNLQIIDINFLGQKKI